MQHAYQLNLFHQIEVQRKPLDAALQVQLQELIDALILDLYQTVFEEEKTKEETIDG